MLEAWFRFGRDEMVGEQGPTWRRLLARCLQAWQSIRENGSRFDLDRPQEVYLVGVERSFYLLALMDLFGLLEVERPPRAVTPWCPAGLKRVPFGDAVFALISSRSDSILGRDFPSGRYRWSRGRQCF